MLISNIDRLIVPKEGFVSGNPYPGPSPYPGPEQGEPTAKAILKELPLCIFDGNSYSQNSEEFSVTSPQYAPSNSRVAFAAEFNPENIQWMPSGKQLLITYTTSDKAGSRETMAFLDVFSGTIRVIGERQFTYAPPIWLDNQKSIAYIEPGEGGNYNIFTKQLIEAAKSAVIAQTSQPYLAIGPNESLTLFSQMGKAQIEIVDAKGSIQTMLNTADLLSVPEWDFGPSLPQPGRFAWNSTFEKLAINSPKGLFFLDIKSGSICHINLGEQNQEKLWPYYVRWSPNNRYLAMLTTSGTGIVPFLNLTILDYLTGKLTQVFPDDSNATSNIYFTDITWSPDSQTIATLVGRGENTGNQLLFVDIATGNSKRVLPDANFYSGGVAGKLDWSPDGDHIAYICLKGPLCILDTNR